MVGNSLRVGEYVGKVVLLYVAVGMKVGNSSRVRENVGNVVLSFVASGSKLDGKEEGTGSSATSVEFVSLAVSAVWDVAF